MVHPGTEQTGSLGAVDGQVASEAAEQIDGLPGRGEGGVNVLQTLIGVRLPLADEIRLGRQGLDEGVQLHLVNAGGADQLHAEGINAPISSRLRE